MCFFGCGGPTDYDEDGTVTAGDFAGSWVQTKCQGQMGCNDVVLMTRVTTDIVAEFTIVNDGLRCHQTGDTGSCIWLGVGIATSALGAAGNSIKIADGALDATKAIKGVGAIGKLKGALNGLKSALTSIPKAIQALFKGVDVLNKRLADKAKALFDLQRLLKDKIKQVENAIR